MALVGAAIVAGVAATTPTYTIDSYFYLVKARSLLEGAGPTVTWGAGADPIFFSGYSFWLAPFLAAFGRDGWIAANVAAHLLAAWALWRLLAPRLPPLEARLAFGLAALNPVWLQWHAVPMSEVLLSAAVLWALAAALRFRATGAIPAALGAGAAGGLALLTRAEGALLGPVLLAVAWPRVRAGRGAWLAAAAALLFLLPEAGHRLWLAARLPRDAGAVGYLEVSARHLREIDVLAGMRTLVEAPFHPTLEEIGERVLYRRFVPPALQAAQWAVEVLWLTALVLALASAGRGRRELALGFLAYALVHGLWFYRYERFIAPLVPAAAVILALGLAQLARGCRRPLVVLGTLAVAVCAVYGLQAGRLHAARLHVHQAERDYRRAAERAAAWAGDAPVISEVGPYVAYDLPGPVLLEGSRPDFHADDVPSRSAGFLRERGVRAVITPRPQGWRVPGARVEEAGGLSVLLLP